MTETSARDRQAVITEAAIAAARAQIGIELPSRGQFNDYATVDTIRHFAYGTGDPNPLFADPEYAATTRWGGMIAPAPFLFTCMGSFPWGMPGVHALWCGAEFECHAPIRAGARIVTTVCLSDVQEKRSDFTGRGVMQTWTFTHRDGEGALLAKTRLWMLRTERDTARERGKYREIQPPHYADAELAAIEEWYDREELRGGRPRYWEDVVEGEELAPVLKGPLTVTDLIGFKVGWGFRPFVMPNRIGWEYRRRHPGLTSKNEQGIWDVPERVHWDTDFARFVGATTAS
ncbi:MAG: MaoC family dehydratase N-terminal domain-containing protein [Chloroflexi bacterium]|nr:MaoC family dehydratase N-terminal domain-containing protein [Chloroflexota bacterium]